MRPAQPAEAQPGDAETPRGIFGSAGDRMAGRTEQTVSPQVPAPASEPVPAEPATPPSGLWGRMEERVAAQAEQPSSRTSLWEYLDAQLHLRKARPRLRSDLVVAQVEEAGTVYRVVKEPTGLNYYRFKENEYFILTLLDGHNEVRDLVRLYSQQYRPIRPDTVEKFIDRAESFGLLVKERPGIYERLLSQPIAAPVARRLATLLRFSYTLPDTDGVTQRIYRRVALAFRGPVVWFWCVLALSGLLLMALGWPRLMGELRGTLGSGWTLVLYLLPLYAGMAVVVVIHELAHALTCVHFGGHVHKMGIMFFYVSLAAFADTSDAWLFASRKARAWVSLAGPLSTLACSAVAAWIWFAAAPGSVVAHVAVMLMLSTVPMSFANLNPFLEYDGYYVLSDLTGIANLRKRAFAYTRAYLRRLWQPAVELPATAPGQPRIFLGYGVLAAAYFVGLVMVPLGFQIVSLLRRYGPLVGGLAAAGLLLMFSQRYIRTLYTRWRAKMHGRAT